MRQAKRKDNEKCGAQRVHLKWIFALKLDFERDSYDLEKL